MNFRRLILPAVLVPAALALTGCSTIVSQSASQQDVIGKVRISVGLCGEDPGLILALSSNGQEAGRTAVSAGPETECPDLSAYGGAPVQIQPLIAVRVPAAASLPSTLTMQLAPGRTVTLAESQSYADELAAASSAEGEVWHGYVATAGVAIEDVPTTPAQIDIDVTLPRSAGTPFAGPLHALVVNGERPVLDEETLSADVDCDDAYLPIACSYVDLSSPDAEYPTRDLAIEPAPAVTSRAGTTAEVRFPVHFRGAADALATFTQTATTGVSGATATPVNATFAPATDEDRTELVDVAIPADAAPGDYPVTLTAKVGGEERTATTTLTVEAAPSPQAEPPAPKVERPAPVVTAKRAPQSISLSASPSRRMGGANRLHVEGTVHKALGITKAVGCRGTVTVRARYARSGDVARFTRKVSASCRFTADVRLARTGQVTVSARFHGNGALAPMTSGGKTVTVR